MKFNTILFVLLLLVAGAFFPQRVSAAAATKVDLIQDVASGGVGVVDMDGPTGFGFVNFNQDANGDLRLTVSIKNAEPDTTYAGAFLVCGPTHALGCGWIDVGDLTTNGQGNGNATMVLSVETLQDSPFGSGSRTDHFDLMKDTGDSSAGIYVASGIDYIVP